MGYKGRLVADMYPDYLFFSEFSESIQDFKFNNHEEELLRGIAYPETRRNFVFLGKHESEDDVGNTCQHETEHDVLGNFQLFGDDDELLLMDIRQEHDMIRNAAWMAKNFDENVYASQINKQMVEPLMSEEEYERLMKKYNKQFEKIRDQLPI